MKPLDRLLQRWRIAVAAPWVRSGSRVLDIGSADGALFDQLRRRGATGIGIDPNSSLIPRADGVRLIRGLFPADAPDGPFDAITMLAVLEHLPAASHAAVVGATARLLRDGGRLIVTVPEPAVDRIVHLLQRLRLAEGMSLEEHHGFSTAQTRTMFEPVGFVLLKHRRFQLGLNNLFVFERRVTKQAAPARRSDDAR